MYTLIRHTDGRVTLRTHVDPADLPPDEARRLLRGLRPLLATLGAAARRTPVPPDRRPVAGEAPKRYRGSREREPVLAG